MNRRLIISIILLSFFCYTQAEKLGKVVYRTITDTHDIGLSVKGGSRNDTNYELLSYISFEGGNLNTGLFSKSTLSFQMKIRPTSSGGGAFLGTGGIDDDHDYRFFMYSNSTYIDVSSSRRNSRVLSLNTDYELEFGNNYLKDITTNKILLSGSTQSFDYTNNSAAYIMVCGKNDKAYYYYLKVYDGGILIRDYIPCKRVKDGALGFLDRLSNNFTPIVGQASAGSERETKQARTIYVSQPGSLSNYISDAEKNDIEELTISGKLNGTDFRFLREMAGRNHLCIATNGHLKVLDLSNAQIVKGGEKYVDIDGIRLEITTDNIVPRFLFHDCNLTKIVLPTSITRFEGEVFENCKNLSSVNIPSNVTFIGGECFMECTSLQTITIPNSVTSIGKDAFKGTPWYNNQSNGVVYAGKVAYTYKGTMGNDTNLSLASGTVGIADNAFENCTGLKSITFPSSIKYIGQYAFRNCTGIQYVYSNITAPSSINSDAFDLNTYNNAILKVPNGKTYTYTNTSGWNNFRNIVDDSNPIITTTIDNVTYELNLNTKYAIVRQIAAEDIDLVIPSSITYNNYSYSVKEVGDYVFQNGINNYSIKSVSFPSSISEVSDYAFRQFAALAIIWNSSTSLPSNSFNTSDYKERNFLLYVNSSWIAPSGMSNVVVNGKASEITLIDGSPFHCPQSFTANKISYSHNYSMTTGVGECAGWETIALPFTVETIKHEYKGDLVTFSNYTFDLNSNYRPFWLYSLSNNGFIRASSIQANTPYLISMPNNNKYTDTYNLSGKITFSSTYVTVESTKDYNLNKASYNGGIFTPNYTLYNASDAFALNVTNDFTTNSNYQNAGSVFLNNYRTIYPFEARFDMKSNTRSIDIIFADGETTDIDNVLFTTGEDKELNIISLSGHIIRKISQRDFENVWNTLPKGVYIVNGKKFIK